MNCAIAILVISIVVMFPFHQLVPTNQVSFPNCKSVNNIKRVFNLFNLIYFEEINNGHSVYWTYDSEHQKYFKADWLWMIAGANLSGVFWKANQSEILTEINEQQLNVKQEVVQYNHGFNIFVNMKDSSWVKTIPADIGLSKELTFYQIKLTRFVYSPKKGSVYQFKIGDSSQIASLSLPRKGSKVNGIFEKDGTIYIYHNANEISTFKEVSKANKIDSYKFNDLFACTKQVELDKLMLLSAIFQGIVILILVLINILILVSFMNYKKRTKQKSVRVESKFDDSTSTSSRFNRVRKLFSTSKKPVAKAKRNKPTGSHQRTVNSSKSTQKTVQIKSSNNQSISSSNSIVKCYVKNKR